MKKIKINDNEIYSEGNITDIKILVEDDRITNVEKFFKHLIVQKEINEISEDFEFDNDVITKLDELPIEIKELFDELLKLVNTYNKVIPEDN